MFRDPQVNFYVQDVEACMTFYRDLFGFEETFRTPETGPPDHVELHIGSFILGLASIESARDTHGLAAADGPPRAEVCLWTDDVDDAYQRLIEQGAQSITPPHTFLNGRLRAAWVADPDGNPVQMVMEN